MNLPPLPLLPSLPALDRLAAVPVSFLWPVALWGLLAVPLALAGYALLQRGSRRASERFARPALMPNLAPRRPGWRRHVPAALYALALAAILTGLARPQVALAVPKEHATVVLLMDTSYSMGATDVQPTRLAAANAAAKRFLDGLPAPLQVALISFSNGATLRTAPTTDRAEVRRALDALQPDGATAMGEAIELAAGVAESAASQDGATATPTPASSGGKVPAAILLLSDGSNTAGQRQPLDAAARARQLGIPIYTIALGTAAGTIEQPEAPGSGQRLSVPPDEETLREVAQLTGGEAFRAPTAEDLQAVYQDIGSRISYTHEQREVTVAVTGAGALLLAAGGALALAWFNRFP